MTSRFGPIREDAIVSSRPASGANVGSGLETHMLRDIRAAGLPEPEREWLFAMPRRWRLDFAWPSKRVAIEVEGGVHTEGRHTRGSGFVEDCRKYNAAALRGWLVLRVAGEHIESGEAIEWLEEALR